MPRTRKDEAPLLLDEPELTGRYVELDGYTVCFESYHTDTDPAPFFRGLPDDRCQCPHWGIVISGKLVVHYADRSEMFTGGDCPLHRARTRSPPVQRHRDRRVQPH